MGARNKDVKVRILSEYYDVGSKAAERAMRRNATLQMQAAHEDIAREQAKAAAIVAANKRQVDAMNVTGKRVMAVSAAIAVGLGLATKAAMSWESAWAGVTKTVDGSAEEMGVLEGQLRGLALVLPATHEEIAGVAEVAGQLGVKRHDIAAFTRTMIDLGETTDMAAAEAATSIAQLSNIMGIGADQASRLGSTVVELGNNSATTESRIIEMALRVAGAGRTVGMTADQTLAYSAALASVGIEAQAGGTAISRVMLQIDSDVASGSDTITKYARTAGMTAEAFATAWRDDAGTALSAFISGLGDLQAEGADTTGALADMGFTQVRVTDALRRAALAGDLLTRSLELGSTAWDANSALAEEAAKRYETTESKLAMARNQINDTAIDIGGNFLPVVADAADWVGSLAAGFSTLPEPMQDWITKLGGATAGLGLLVGGAAVGIPKLRELQTTVVALRGGSSLLGKALGGTASTLMGPWGLAIAGAVTVLGFWIKAQGDAKRDTEEMIQTLDDQTAAITDNTRALVFQRLEEDGMIEIAKRAGVELNTLVDAAINPTSQAYFELSGMVRAAREEMETQTEGGVWAGPETAEQRDRLAELETVLGAVGVQQGDVAESQALMRDQIAAGLGTTEDATQAQSIYNMALGEGGELAEAAGSAIDELTRALTDLNSPALDAEAAESRFQATLDKVNAALEENGQNLDLTTEAGRANRDILRELASDGIARANALVELTGSEEEFRASLDASRQSLADTAIQFGMTEEEAWAYVDSVLAIPDEAAVKATFDAQAAVEAMETFVNHWSGYNIPLNVNLNSDNFLAGIQRVQRQAGVSVMEHDGGILEFYGRGGLRPMAPVAQMVPANTWRVVGDRAKDDEAYIPIDGSAQSRAILEETNRRFGNVGGPGQYVTKADLIGPGPARVTAGEPVAGLRPVEIHNHGDIIAADPAEAMRAQGSEMSWELGGL